jgi:hypothetical protein
MEILDVKADGITEGTVLEDTILEDIAKIADS